MPSYFNTEEELRKIWSDPITRKSLLDKLADAGYGKSELEELQKVVDAENSDLFDVLEYIAFHIQPIARSERALQARPKIFESLSTTQRDFLEFVLFKYIDTGVWELDQAKLPSLIELKYSSITDGMEVLGGVNDVRNLFFGFQKHLYTNSTPAAQD